jgi:L-lactate permease
MWHHNYIPIAGSLGISALVGGLPIFVLLWLLGVKRKPAWIAGVAGLGAAAAATGLHGEDEAKLSRFTLRHSIVLASLIGLVTTAWAYVLR